MISCRQHRHMMSLRNPHYLVFALSARVSSTQLSRDRFTLDLSIFYRNDVTFGMFSVHMMTENQSRALRLHRNETEKSCEQ